MHEGCIKAVIDWEFAGSYPLSELLDSPTGIDVLEMESEGDVDESWKWGACIMDLAEEAVKARGWKERAVELLVRKENSNLQLARMEMVPVDFGVDDQAEEGQQDEAAKEKEKESIES